MFTLIFDLAEILPVILYVCFLKRNRHEGLQVIFWYAFISLCFEVLFKIDRNNVYTFFLFSGFTVIEYTFFTAFLVLSNKDKLFRIIAAIGSVIFYIVAIVNFQIQKNQNFQIQKSPAFDSLAASVEAICIIIYSIVYLYHLIRDPAVMFVYQTKKFWIVIAFFIYFSSTLFLFLYAPTFTYQQNRTYWYINNTFDIVKNVLFCIAFSMKKNKAPNPIENMYADI